MNQRVQIHRALFVETGTYNDMVSRPYETVGDFNIINQFQEVTQGGRYLSPQNLAGIAGNFLRPAGEAERDANNNPMIVGIGNGWGQSRFRFMLDAFEPGNFGGTRYIVTGFTDFTGVAQSGQIHPQMICTFNNVQTLRILQDTTPMGSGTRATVHESAHIIGGDYNPGFNTPVNTNTYSMRPNDVFGRIMTLDLNDVHDYRLNFSERHKKSHRRNGNTATYLSNTLKSYASAVEDDTMGSAMDMVGKMDSARGMVPEPTFSTDHFFGRIKDTSFAEGTSVTFGELSNAFPELLDPKVTKVQLARGDMLQQLHQTGRTEYWHGSSMQTVAATALAHSVPSLMMDLMLTKVRVWAHNRTMDGQYEIAVLDPKSFTTGIDLTPYLNRFIERLKFEVLNGLTKNNLIDFDLNLVVDIMGETWISISMNGEAHIDYAVPSFSDALFAPVLTQNEQNLSNLAYDINSLASNLDVTYESFNGQQAGNYTLGGSDGTNTAI